MRNDESFQVTFDGVVKVAKINDIPAPRTASPAASLSDEEIALQKELVNCHPLQLTASIVMSTVGSRDCLVNADENNVVRHLRCEMFGVLDRMNGELHRRFYSIGVTLAAIMTLSSTSDTRENTSTSRILFLSRD